MGQKIRVIVAKSARDDLSEIFDYLNSEAPRLVSKIASELQVGLKRLYRFPKSGRMIPEIGEGSLRELIVGPYRIMYRLEPKRTVVLRAIHGKRFFSGAL